jgi:hypothetical protein
MFILISASTSMGCMVFQGLKISIESTRPTDIVDEDRKINVLQTCNDVIYG